MPVSRHASLLQRNAFVLIRRDDSNLFLYELVQALVRDIPTEPLFFSSREDSYTYARDEYGQWWCSHRKVDLAKHGFTPLEDLLHKYPPRRP